MESWKKKLPDYNFILWNFSRFAHGKSKWVDEAYARKKYAFAADYIRLYALYNYGGIYLDMDVEVCKSFNPLLKLNTMLCWQRSIGGLEVAAFGVEKGSLWIKECLDEYDRKTFVQKDNSFDMLPLPNRIESFLKKENYSLVSVKSITEAFNVNSKKSIPVFSYDFFSPKSYLSGKIKKTKNTFCVHHFAGSWTSKNKKTILHQIKDLFWTKTGLADLQLKKVLFKNRG